MPDRVTDTMTRDVHTFLPLIVANGLNVLGAIAILITGIWLSGKAHALIVRMLGRMPHLDQMLVGFCGGIVRYLILTVTVLAVLSQFGIQTTSLIAVLGAAGLAVGLALQGTLSNLAAGVMLLIFRPFKIGHFVQVGGVHGTVKELSLFWTELVTGDNVQVIVPNGNVWGQPLQNFSYYPVDGFEVQFAIPERVDLDSVLSSARSVVESDARIVRNPASVVALDHASANTLEMVVKVWTSSGNVPAVKTDLIKSVREILSAEIVGESARVG
jgi:small conductance mechanosensitive channel